MCVTKIRSLREQEAVCVRVHIPFCACAFVCSILALFLRRPNRRENVGEWRAAEGGLAFRSLADARDLAVFVRSQTLAILRRKWLPSLLTMSRA